MRTKEVPLCLGAYETGAVMARRGASLVPPPWRVNYARVGAVRTMRLSLHSSFTQSPSTPSDSAASSPHMANLNAALRAYPDGHLT